MPTPSLNNGIFLRDKSVMVSSHLDSYHLRNILSETEPDNMGPVDIWATTQKVQMPLYQMSSFDGKNIIDVENPNGEWKWETPISEELPFVMEDIEPGNIMKGVDGTTFRIKMNKRRFGHGDIITYDKFNGVELYITSDDILDTGDGVIYTVRMVNTDSDAPFPDAILGCNTTFFRIGSHISEHGQKYSDMQEEVRSREFYNFVGNSSAHVHYSVSSRAKLMADGGMTLDGRLNITEIWKADDSIMDPSFRTLDDMVKIKGDSWVKKQRESGNLVKTFITRMEAKHMSKIARDIENYLMWGKGGKISDPNDGADDGRLSVGLWKQLDSSFKHIYNKSDFRLAMFRAELMNFFRGKVDFDGPESNRELVIQTGMAGMQLISEAVLKEAVASGLVMNASELGAITEKGMDLGFGFAFTHFKIPYLANVRFVLNPAFDNVDNNSIENPVIDGYPLSSYSFIIFDVTDTGSDNIKMLRKKYDHEMVWSYENGKIDYMGRKNGFQSSGRGFGFRVFMEQAYPAIWVKDPTKVLKIVMRNPKTGFAL